MSSRRKLGEKGLKNMITMAYEVSMLYHLFIYYCGLGNIY